MKNDDYIGVDEKYIPEEEKNKESYVSGGISQKNRNRLVKGGIAFIIIWAVIAIVVMAIIFSVAFGMFNKGNRMINKTNEIMNKEDINDELDFYLGEGKGIEVKSLLEKVVKINKTNKKHAITIIYESHTTKNSAEIIDIKHSIDEMSDYDSNADYDSKGYINKITITKEN